MSHRSLAPLESEPLFSEAQRSEQRLIRSCLEPLGNYLAQQLGVSKNGTASAAMNASKTLSLSIVPIRSSD